MTADIPVHGVVPGTLVGLLYDYLDAHGLAADTLLGETRPDPGPHGLARYPAAGWQGLLERAAARLNDPLLGLKLGQTATAAHFGVMGYVLHNCADLGAAFERYRRFERLIYDMEPVQFSQDADALVLEWGLGHGRPGPLVDETAITALVAFARALTGRTLAPLSVHFVNPRPADVSPYQDYFRCPVHFEEPHTRIRIPRPMLDLPLQQADPALLGLLEAQAEALLAQLPPGGQLEDDVRRLIARLLPDREPTLAAVAERIGLSERTLHRRLAARGVHFRMLRDDTRRQLAQRYLADPRLTLAEVALLLGYAEQSAFSRAFRNWTGESPGRYQARNALP
ncbi:AraC family transcriptional regulator [Spectribacter hydrogenoxidans]|uniref:AraC family transcriptional regulator n=1 Tax=Spectribacter hydrogenoxidans TaxID=3075608 RepID=A0ABU3BYY0_9GAMM|nr:AraC family transcriptional regulator [Salinisphaera sp. W335]MDT0634480.1 AraC family transcriptional regulator [Salinisphaera sp. W335]